MRRRHPPEIEDYPWCPKPVRDGGTDWLRFMADLTGAFHGVAPLLRRAMEATGTHQIVDLGSGGMGPWGTLEPVLSESGPLEVMLTDLYPNAEAQAFARERSAGRLKTRGEPVDATDVPPGLRGVRTLFNAFHHFRPELARAILEDAVRKERAIAVFEGFHSRWLGLAFVALQAPAVLLLTPFVRPFRWWRLVLTYVLPVIPALIWFDGTMSMFRLYLTPDLRALVATVEGHERFDWDIGTTAIKGIPFARVQHLVGTPISERSTPGA